LGGTMLPKFSVQTSAARVVVRFRQPEFASEAFIRFDHDVLRRLAHAGLPVPLPLSRRDGTSWLRVEGGTLEALSWIDGESFEGGGLALHNLGQCLARL